MLDFPNTPVVGDTLELDGIVWVWDGVKWAHAEGASPGGGIPRISTGQFPPASPSPGDLWFDPIEGQLYIYFNDGSSSQWVVTINKMGAQGAPGPQGTPGTPGAQGPQGVPGPNTMPQGITNGGPAAGGQVGELRTVTMAVTTALQGSVPVSLCSLSLTAGDWTLFGDASFGSTLSSIASLGLDISTDITGYHLKLVALNNNILSTFFLSASENLNLTATTTVYLKAVGSATAAGIVNATMGKLFARRMR